MSITLQSDPLGFVYYTKQGGQILGVINTRSPLFTINPVTFTGITDHRDDNLFQLVFLVCGIVLLLILIIIVVIAYVCYRRSQELEREYWSMHQAFDEAHGKMQEDAFSDARSKRSASMIGSMTGSMRNPLIEGGSYYDGVPQRSVSRSNFYIMDNIEGDANMENGNSMYGRMASQRGSQDMIRANSFQNMIRTNGSQNMIRTNGSQNMIRTNGSQNMIRTNGSQNMIRANSSQNMIRANSSRGSGQW